jgi:phage shock protein PspC (stress-responsive transcriptional regulator)
VILHVVLEHDEAIRSGDGNEIVTLELKEKFNPKHYLNYLQLIESKEWVQCEKRIKSVDKITIDSWLERLLVERLERKTENILQSLRTNNNNWEETFYHQLAKNFGFRINALPFEMLAKNLPLTYLAKHKNNLNQIESLLFGQAGLLEKKYKEDYPNELKKEYDFLKKKFLLRPLDGSQWKFLRLRPSNFPTIRIAQFAQLIHKSSHLFSRILETEKIYDLKSLFEVSVSDYWLTHYVFDKASSRRGKHLGESAMLIIFINAVVPFLFAYGRQRLSEIHEVRALSFLEKLSAEKNSIISHWELLGIFSKNAAHTQALLQLKSEYCSEKKCLNCAVGNKIIGSIEKRAFGVCEWLGTKLRMRSSNIRLFFIYTSFLAVGSPFIIYLILAFWLKMKNYVFSKRTSVWDL